MLSSFFICHSLSDLPSSTYSPHTHLLPFKFSLFCLWEIFLENSVGNENREHFELLKMFHSWLRICLFLRAVGLICFAILFCIRQKHFSTKPWYEWMDALRNEGIEGHDSTFPHLISVLHGSAKPLPESADQRCVSPVGRCYFTYHKCQLLSIHSSSSVVKTRDWKDLFYIYFITYYTMWHEREKLSYQAAHTTSPGFYSTQAVLCNVSSRLLICSDTHWLDYCSPTVVAKRSPGCSLITCDLTADTQERRNDCTHQLTSDCIWQGSERGHLAGLSLCRITKKVETKVCVLNMYFALDTCEVMPLDKT